MNWREGLKFIRFPAQVRNNNWPYSPPERRGGRAGTGAAGVVGHGFPHSFMNLFDRVPYPVSIGPPQPQYRCWGGILLEVHADHPGRAGRGHPSFRRGIWPVIVSYLSYMKADKHQPLPPIHSHLRRQRTQGTTEI